MAYLYVYVSNVSPIQYSSDVIKIVRGDDYFASDGLSIDFQDTSGSWPDLSGASILFTAKNSTRDSTLSVAGSVVVPAGNAKVVRAEPTSAQTTPLKVGDYKYDVQATLSNGHRVTLITNSPMKVLEDYSP